MPIFNLFSKRQKALIEKPSDILIYDNIPQTLRVQIIHILTDAFGSSYNGEYQENVFLILHKILCREYGVFELNRFNRFQEKVFNYILDEKNIDQVLDCVEVCFKYIDITLRNDWNYLHSNTINISQDDAIDELNARFKQHAIGYQFETGELIKVDSTYIHSEIVKPALNLLFNKKFAGADEEYRKAHEHYRHGRNKECLNDCLKAFESTMKIIYSTKGWSFDSKATASALVKIGFDNNLVPSYLQSQFLSLKSLLDSGVNTIRNRIGGHGQGINISQADDETTRYCLNLTGANIIYLIELSRL